jgi:hypothetical protein
LELFARGLSIGARSQSQQCEDANERVAGRFHACFFLFDEVFPKLRFALPRLHLL